MRLDSKQSTLPKEMEMERRIAICAFLFILFMVAYSNGDTVPKGTVELFESNQYLPPPQAGVDNPGDQLAVIFAPVPGTIGVSVAANCRGELFYTNYQVDSLYKMTAAGVLLDRVPLRDPTGAPISIGEMSWDEGRQMLWGATDDSPTHGIYLIDPVTGMATYQFTGMGGYDLTDGLAFDPTDGTIWHSTDVSDSIAHFSATGLLLGYLTPLDANGLPQGLVSGICVGTNNTMYVGHNGLGLITRVNKSTGAFISTFAVPGGRDEGMECDAINFAPTLAVWVKGAYDNSFTAFEVDTGTCVCYQPPDTCELPYQEVDLGDLQACNYPTMSRNPAHALTGVAWLGPGITGEASPNSVDLDPMDDGVIYHNLPWTPCTQVSVTVTVTAGPNYSYFLEVCGGHLYLNGWKDGNLDGDFCDTLCQVAGAPGADEWIVQDVLVTPGAWNFTFIDPGVTDMGIYDGVFRWRLTSQPVGRQGFGLMDPACPNMNCGTYGFDLVGEVEDYIIHDGQLPVELTSFTAVAGNGLVSLRWNTASETDNSHFTIYRRTSTDSHFSSLVNIPGNGTTSQPHDYTYVDHSVTNGVTYEYQLADVDINGAETVHDIIVSATPESGATIPTEYGLYQNYPNPFNPSTHIRFDIKEAGHVTLKVYDLLGREVATLVNGDVPAGSHSITWNASKLASGIYLYQLKAGDFTATKKLVLMK
jgi:hypothetical protein